MDLRTKFHVRILPQTVDRQAFTRDGRDRHALFASPSTATRLRIKPSRSASATPGDTYASSTSTRSKVTCAKAAVIGLRRSTGIENERAHGTRRISVTRGKKTRHTYSVIPIPFRLNSRQAKQRYILAFARVTLAPAAAMLDASSRCAAIGGRAHLPARKSRQSPVLSRPLLPNTGRARAMGTVDLIFCSSMP